MHIHFVQSIDIGDGGGLGAAALDLHKSLIHYKNNNKSIKNSNKKINQFSKFNLDSYLLCTSNKKDLNWEKGVIKGKRIGPKSFFFSPELKISSSKLLDEAEYINGHGLYVWPNMWLGREAKKRKIKLIYHTHGFFDPWILKRSKFKKYIAKMLFEDSNFKNVALWRALTKKEARQIKNTIGEDIKVEIIPNGINLKLIDNYIKEKEKYKVTEDLLYKDKNIGKNELSCFYERKEKKILFLGRLHPKKGLKNLIYAWGKISKNFKEWELLIVGPDQNGYKKVLQNIVADIGCSSNCKIFGQVTGIKKHILLNTCDVVILPSFSEGFPMSLLEAAAHRKPIIQSTECNFEDLSKENISWDCKPNVEDIERVIKIVLNTDDSELIDRGQAARNLIENKYTWEKISEKFIHKVNNI